MASDNQCVACGQWAGKGHRCPSPVSLSGDFLSAPRPPLGSLSGGESEAVAARVAVANEYISTRTSALDTFDEDISACPACGEPMDYCQGHGEIGDPAGYAILQAHDDDDHSRCVGECAMDQTPEEHMAAVDEEVARAAEVERENLQWQDEGAAFGRRLSNAELYAAMDELNTELDILDNSRFPMQGQDGENLQLWRRRYNRLVGLTGVGMDRGLIDHMGYRRTLPAENAE